MNMMLQAFSIWRALSPLLRHRVTTVSKHLWSREAALTDCSFPAEGKSLSK